MISSRWPSTIMLTYQLIASYRQYTKPRAESHRSTTSSLSLCPGTLNYHRSLPYRCLSSRPICLSRARLELFCAQVPEVHCTIC